MGVIKVSGNFQPSNDFKYYNGVKYWNNFDVVLENQNKLITGDRNKFWQEYVLHKYGKFDDSFFFNCGNGWVERDLYAKGLIGTATAFDFSAELIEASIKIAFSLGLPFNYFVADCNNLEIMSKSYDVVVNNAAMHHVAFVNRLTHNLALSLRRGGYYIGFDYVGPHRNQYPFEIWSQIIKLNNKLPERYRKKLVYPHIKTMLATDPTEAIHSELQLKVFERYFNFEEFVPLGGSIAHELLFNNLCLHQEQHTVDGKNVLKYILDEDFNFINSFPNFNFFAFWIGKVKDNNFPDSNQIYLWQQEENSREQSASENQGRYYEPLALEIIYDDFDQLLRNSKNDLSF
jgi:SAM-dependent methyltransferase